MKTQRRTADEQYQLIMECRSSGLSAEMSDEELEQFAPWSELAQETCK